MGVFSSCVSHEKYAYKNILIFISNVSLTDFNQLATPKDIFYPPTWWHVTYLQFHLVSIKVSPRCTDHKHKIYTKIYQANLKRIISDYGISEAPIAEWVKP